MQELLLLRPYFGQTVIVGHWTMPVNPSRKDIISGCLSFALGRPQSSSLLYCLYYASLGGELEPITHEAQNPHTGILMLIVFSHYKPGVNSAKRLSILAISNPPV